MLPAPSAQGERLRPSRRYRATGVEHRLQLLEPASLVGQSLFRAEPTGEGTKLRVVERLWQIERYDSYLPV
ncbi:MAG TPA: hypothetical protein V6D29_00140 [Leptolyngbyaceae cyanobacterium]